MKIKKIAEKFSICKLKTIEQADFSGDMVFLSKTDQEISLVCPDRLAPADCLEKDGGWRAFRIEGTLDFSLIGILAHISNLLAENQISLFAVSTYNTDYFLVKKERFERAVHGLRQKGYEVVE